MAKKKTQAVPDATTLIRAADDFKNELLQRIAIGEDYLGRTIQTEADYIQLKQGYSDWNDYNQEMINRAFNNPYSEYYYDYSRINNMTGLLDGVRKDIRTSDPTYKVNLVQEKLKNCVTWLNRLVGKLHLITGNNSTNMHTAKEKTFYNCGFIVHGHNEATKYEVARFIENELKKKAIILHEQPSKGFTIMEKFENYSSVDFAVALWTADDTGKANKEEKVNGRARQNVIFETGFFIGKLSRQNVIVLYEHGVEIPSDYSGVIFIPLTGNWKNDLRKEIEAIYQNES